MAGAQIIHVRSSEEPRGSGLGTINHAEWDGEQGQSGLLASNRESSPLYLKGNMDNLEANQPSELHPSQTISIREESHGRSKVIRSQFLSEEESNQVRDPSIPNVLVKKNLKQRDFILWLYAENPLTY